MTENTITLDLNEFYAMSADEGIATLGKMFPQVQQAEALAYVSGASKAMSMFVAPQIALGLIRDWSQCDVLMLCGMLYAHAESKKQVSLTGAGSMMVH